MQTYQGKPCVSVRPAKQGDVGFDTTKEQIVIRMDSGKEQVADLTELTGYAPPAALAPSAPVAPAVVQAPAP